MSISFLGNERGQKQTGMTTRITLGKTIQVMLLNFLAQWSLASKDVWKEEFSTKEKKLVEGEQRSFWMRKGRTRLECPLKSSWGELGLATDFYGGVQLQKMFPEGKGIQHGMKHIMGTGGGESQTGMTTKSTVAWVRLENWPQMTHVIV